jgi:hypothetical protein
MHTHVSKLICLAVFFSILLLPAFSGAAETVLFDQTTLGFPGFDTMGPAGFSFLKSSLEQSGYNTADSVSKGANFGVINQVSLKGVNNFFIVNPMRPLSVDEQNLLSLFVKNGGDLFIICDSPHAVNVSNSILRNYGLSFQNIQLEGVTLSFLQNMSLVNQAIPLLFGDMSTELPVYEWTTPSTLEPAYLKYMDSSILVNSTYESWNDSNGNRSATGGEKILLASILEGKGSVTALGTSELFTNYRMDEGEVLINYILDLTDLNKVMASNLKSVIDYPDIWRLRFMEDKVHLFQFELKNKTNYPFLVSVIASDRISALLEPANTTILLEPSENKTINYRFHDYNQEYCVIGDELLFNVSIQDERFSSVLDREFSNKIILNAEHMI